MEGDLWASPPSFQPLFPVIKMWDEEVAKSPREHVSEKPDVLITLLDLQ
jgi:hypothetical protein